MQINGMVKMVKQLYMNMKHPMQPLHFDAHGTIRFKKNEIVEFLLDNGGFDMNKLAHIEFSDEDREQFAQLIGYSVGGFGELSYVSDDAYYASVSAAERLQLERTNG